MPIDDRYNQYTEDEAKFSAPPNAYTWERPNFPQPRGGSFTLTGPSGGGGGGGGAASPKTTEKPGDEFERRWRESEDRALRLSQQYEGSRPWSASPGDYEDVLGPERSGGLSAVAGGGNPNTGLHPDQPIPNFGNGGSVSTPVGSPYL